MSYLHCHNCDFHQDDFWSKDGWNPIKYLEDWKKDLFSPELDEPFTNDAGFIRRNGNITLREVIARSIERSANLIRNMKYRTEKEFKEKNPDRICPQCGKKELDID
jgi:hypothetical protein